MSVAAARAGAGIVAVVGATASGKSELALDLAQALGGEIVNTDSMQLYRGMDVGTAKLPRSQRRGIPHHLLDVLDVTEPATVAEFQVRAREVVAGCAARGVVPVLVGGSALYTRAVLDEFTFPGTDPDVRRRWQRELAERGPQALHRRLAELDPEAASRIITSNGRRIVRALEVIELTGRPFTAALPGSDYRDYHVADTVQVGLDVPPSNLDHRIARRVETMWASGLMAEVARLAGRGLRDGPTASRAIGYAQVLDLLDGRTSEDEARMATVRATRRFARRQLSWYRRDERIVWVDGEDPNRSAKALDAVSAGRAAPRSRPR